MAEDSYHVFEVDGLTPATAETLGEALNLLDNTGVGVSSQEYTPVAGNPQLLQDTMRINIGGPSIDAYVVNVRAEIITITGSPATIDTPVITEAARVRTAQDVLAGRTEQINVIDSLLFSMASGDLTSRKGEVYSANGTINYQQAGPTPELPAVDLPANDSYFTDAAPSSWMKPHNANFFVEWWAMHKPGNPPNTQVFWDYSTENGATSGVAIVYTSTMLQLVVSDGTNLHITEYDHGGAIWEDSTWHRGAFVAMRTANKAHCILDNLIVPTTKQSGTKFLYEVGDINPSGGVRVGARSYIVGSDNLQFRGEVAAIRLGGIIV